MANLITKTVTDLPTPPQSDDLINFDTRADAFVVALDALADDVNEWAGQVNAVALNINGFISGDFKGNWSASPTTYSIGDTVYYTVDGEYYRNLTGTNTATPPDSDTTNWDVVESVGKFNTIASNVMIYGSLAINGSNIDITSAVFAYTTAKDKNGYTVLSESVASASVDMSSAADGDNYIYKTLEGGYTVTATEPDLVALAESGSNFSYVNKKIDVLSGIPQSISDWDGAYENIIRNTVFTGRVNLSENVKIVDFGTAVNNNRYVIDNPFGNENFEHCIARAELYINSKWSEAGWIYTSGGATSYGCKSFSNAEGLVVLTGKTYLTTLSTNQGGGFEATTNITSAPCRVIVQYIGEAKDA